MHIFCLITLLAFSSNTAVGCYILYKNSKNWINIIFSLVAFSVSIWALSSFFILISSTVETALYWGKICTISTSLMAAFLLHFCLAQSGNTTIFKNKIPNLFLYIPPLLIILLDLTTKLIIGAMKETPWGYSPVLGPLYNIKTIFILSYVTASILICYKHYSNSNSKDEKSRIKIIIFAILIPTVVGIVFGVILPLIGYDSPPLSIQFTIITTFLIGYAIVKYNLSSPLVFNLQKKAMAIITCIVVLFSAITLIPCYAMASSGITRGVFINLQSDLNARTEYIESFVNEHLDIVELITYEDTFTDALLTNPNDINYSKIINNVYNRINEILLIHNDFYSINLYDNNKTIIASSTNNTVWTNKIVEDVFINGLKNRYIGPVILNSNFSNYVVPLLVPIKIENTTIGVFIVIHSLDELYAILEVTTNLGETGEVYLVNQDGLMISPSRFIKNSVLNQTIESEAFRQGLLQVSLSDEELKEQTDKILTYFDYRGEYVIGTYGVISLTGWILIAKIDESEALASLHGLNNMFISFFFIFIIFGFIFSFVISKKITRPIIDLKEASARIGAGDFDTKINIISNDEIGELANSFTKMMKMLKNSKNEIESYSKNLEFKVEERTKELNKSKEDQKQYIIELEKNKLAMSHMMKDLNNTVQNLSKTEQEVLKLNKELERKVEERTSKIEQLLKQKDDFVNQLGHDLKNPLGPLVQLLPLLDKHENDPKYKEMIVILQRNVQYMKNLVTKTIELAKLNSPNTAFTFEELNFHDELQEILNDNQFLFNEKQIQINNFIPSNLDFRGDKLRVHELLNNLFNNVVKFSNEKGMVTINSDQNEDFITISIQDTGIGMNEEQLENIFNEFYKADSSRHDFDSSGLGMTICKRIIEKHGGEIWVESEGLGKGTTFYFTLPTKYMNEVNHTDKHETISGEVDNLLANNS
jgi:signal transduction histidine kinase/HAMP domain-containing protein